MSEIHAAEYAGAAASGSYDDVGAQDGSGSAGPEDGNEGSSSNSNLSGRGSERAARSGRGGERRGARRGVEGGSVGSEARRNTRGGGVPRSSPHQPQQQQRIHNPMVDATRVVKRPISETRNTRQFQLTQLQKRFRFKGDDGTKTEFSINLAPSDPDFPYAVDELKFVLTVPLGYGATVSDGTAEVDNENWPTIHVLNEDIPIGFKINIEKGFKGIVKNATKSTTLLDMVNTLDKRLEEFLAAEKAKTIKIIPNAPSKASSSTATLRNDVSGVEPTKSGHLVPHTAYTDPPAAVKSHQPAMPSYTPEQIAAAAARRAQDVRQLEARLGRLEVYSRTETTHGETVYTVPLEARRKDLLPAPLLTVRSVILRVPKLFNLEPCSIKFTGAGITRNVTEILEKKIMEQVEGNPNWSLMAHLNALAANLHVLGTKAIAEEASASASASAETERQQEQEKMLVEEFANKAIIDTEHNPLTTGKGPGNMGSAHDDKEHIVVIPRPPEWSYAGDEEESDSDSENASDYDDNSEDGEEKKAEAPSDSRERGTALLFPGIQMSGIELLEVLFINLTVRCTKCKTTVDVLQIRPGGKPRFSRCEKCSSIYGVGFRMEHVHQFSNRAGFFDLAGCTITNILPSNFLPHCASCDTPLPPPGIANLVPGQTLSTNCRQCHLKMGLFIPEMKLLRVSHDDDATLEAPRGLLAKKVKKEERLVAGTELPNRGRCVHYRKSTRWFRFSCCLKVYPCDKCHDEQQQQQHTAEHANRMICGRCSREQNYRPNDCAYCGHDFIRKVTGYWEGGKGTRDRRLLRKNDPRKYKRVAKPVPGE